MSGQDMGKGLENGKTVTLDKEGEAWYKQTIVNLKIKRHFNNFWQRESILLINGEQGGLLGPK